MNLRVRRVTGVSAMVVDVEASKQSDGVEGELEILGCGLA